MIFQSPYQLDGKSWKKSCSQEEGNSAYIEESYSFSGDKFEYSLISYADPDCSPEKKLSTLKNIGNFKLDQNEGLILNYEEFFMTFHDEDLVNNQNDIGFCGIYDWEVNSDPVSVEGLPYCGDPEDESIVFEDRTSSVRAYRYNSDSSVIFIEYENGLSDKFKLVQNEE